MNLLNRPALRRWLLTLGAVVLIGVSFMAGRWLQPDAPAAEAHAVADAHDHDHDQGHDAETTGNGQTIYYCSMHPEQQSTDPDDTCPICGMALIPMADDAHDDDDADAPVLRLTERSMRLLDIQSMPAERRAARADVRFVGKLEADERRTVDVVVRSDSYIETLYANYMWKSLDEGEPIAELYSPQVNAAARELLVAHRRERADTLEAAKSRLERLGVSRDHIDRIIEEGHVPRTYPVRAPRAGVVNEMGGHEGHWLAEGEHLAEITDLSTLWLWLEVYETDLQWLRTGQDATFSVQAYPGERFEGTVSFINPVMNEPTRTARVRLDVPNPNGRLKPGMFARGDVSIEVAGDHNDDAPLLIPRTAPLITGERAIVYVRRPNTERPTFEGRQITLGPRVGEHYIVRDGLDEGERVVTHGQFKLDSELQIRGRPSMMGRGELFDPHRHHGRDDHDDHDDQDEHDHVDVTALPGVPADYPLSTCVVSGLALGAMGDPVVHEHAGRAVVFCCAACIPEFEDDPERFLTMIDEAKP